MIMRDDVFLSHRKPLAWQPEKKDYPFTLKELELDPARTALLIVDMTNLNLVSGVRSLRNYPDALPNNIKLKDFFRQKRLPVIYCAVGSFLPDSRDRHPKSRASWMRPSASEPSYLSHKGTAAYQVMEELTPLPSEPVIDKNCQGAFNCSAIQHYLWGMTVHNLVVSGMATAHCVASTARDAADLGYNVILVEDACADGNIRTHQATVRTFGQLFGAVKSTAEVIAWLSRESTEA